MEIARDPQARIRELSAAAGITERATAAIIADLVAAGYVTRKRVGRRNHYSVNQDLGFRHAAQRDLRVGPFLELLAQEPAAPAAPGAPAAPAAPSAPAAECGDLLKDV